MLVKPAAKRCLESERAGEELHGQRMFDQLKARGEIDSARLPRARGFR